MVLNLVCKTTIYAGIMPIPFVKAASGFTTADGLPVCYPSNKNSGRTGALTSCYYADNEVVLLRSTSCWDTKPFRKRYKTKNMKVKTCHRCTQEHTTLFRIQIERKGPWIFVCEECCLEFKKGPFYRYGGTWKGYRH